MRMRILVAMTVMVTTAFGALLALPAPSGAQNSSQPALVSTNPVDYTPYIQDDPATPSLEKVNAVAVVGNRVILGGIFSTVKGWYGGPTLTRRNLMAFDATTGVIDARFAPKVDGEVTSLRRAPGGTSVFVGGKFKTVNGAAAVGLTKLSVTTGHRLTVFKASTDGWVLTLVTRGTRLYVGGTFNRIRSVVHPYLAAVDSTSGAIDPTLNIPISLALRNSVFVRQLDVTPAGDRLVMIGNFRQVGGRARSQLAILNLTTAPATVADWNTDGYRPGVCSTRVDAYARDIDLSPDGRYFVVVSSGAWKGTGTLCDTAARWEVFTSGQIKPTWVDYSGGDSLTSVAVTGSAVYVGGHQRWMNNSNTQNGKSAGSGALSRNGISAHDPVNGMAYSWNPGRDRGAGVFDLFATPQGLYVGHDTDNVAGEYHPRIAYFPLAGGVTPTPVVEPTLPTTLYTAQADDTLLSRAYDGLSFGGTTTVDSVGWSHVRGAFTVNRDLYTGMDDGRLLRRSFDGTTFGPPVNAGSWLNFASATGMFFTNGRLYYTRLGDRNLYFRKFEPENGAIGSQLFIVSGNGDGLNWSATAGMTTVGGKLYVANTFGTLRSLVLFGGVPVTGSSTVLSGPTVDGRSWSSYGMFAR